MAMRRYTYAKRSSSARRDANIRRKAEGEEKGNAEIPELDPKLRQHIGVIFVIFLCDVFYGVGSISDLELVRLDGSVGFIPGLTILPKTAAYVAPILVLAFHLLVLIFADASAARWHAWLKLQRGIVKWIVSFVAFFMPMMAIGYVLFRFSYLHDLQLTAVNFLVFVLDAFMVFYFYVSIAFPASRKRKRRYWELIWTGSLLPTRAVLTWIMQGRLSAVKISWSRLVSQTVFAMLVAAACFYLVVVKLITSDKGYKTIAAYMKGDPVGTIIRLLHDQDYYDGYDARVEPELNYWIPMPVLSIDGVAVADSTLTRHTVVVEGLSHIVNDSIHIDHATSIDLHERDFTLARFTGCFFNRANMIRVRMMGARLTDAKFYNALFAGAKLDYMTAKNADFETAVFDWATFAASDVRHANLKGVRLDNIELGDTDFECSDLTGARIRYSRLSGNKLTCVKMTDINFQGAHLENLDLAGKDLSGVILKGTILKEINLCGTTLRNADLRGANCMWLSMQGADLSDAKVDGAVFDRCFVSCVNWPQDISTSTLFALTAVYLSHFPSDEEIQKKDLFFKSKYDGRSNYAQKMKRAKAEFGTRFGYSETKELVTEQFIRGRIELLYDRRIPIIHLLIHKPSVASYLNLDSITRFNKMIVDYCLKNHPRRIDELRLYGHNHGDYPGAELKTFL